MAMISKKEGQPGYLRTVAICQLLKRPRATPAREVVRKSPPKPTRLNVYAESGVELKTIGLGCTSRVSV